MYVHRVLGYSAKSIWYAGVMASNMFMDALMDPGNKKAPPKSAKKKVVAPNKTSVMPSVMVCSIMNIFAL